MTSYALQQDTSISEIEFQQNQLIIDPAGCLFWPDEKLLVVSDLHLEKGSSFASRKGLFIPPYDTQATLEMLALSIVEWAPKTVISLGDSFHDDDASTRLPASYRQNLSQLMEGRDWIWICGNHDPSPPKDLGGTFCEEMFVGNLHFKHEPGQDFKPGEIAGHLHPSAKIRKRGKSIRRRCVAGDGNRLILPAFGTFTGGLDLNHSAFDGLFDKASLKAWMLSGKNVFEIDGKQLAS